MQYIMFYLSESEYNPNENENNIDLAKMASQSQLV